ncbi:retron St85 family RNA-directed DNA polymerase [Muricauda sp. CAU 1633]|uniref:retron St85 family RNA-directed DNA polymerase n=1 Tax=Allomuricauda sp. CAU 1633 TaxID=2816036 RepID=UPI001A8C9A12|nr:retron St85 family RNA-directed DNA polymerase [Muricauda sp. CAU 1633]MBO0320746.1 retron St85 family RNA-directed DNA polymerase [Muricauda sp. CAU 1633]
MKALDKLILEVGLSRNVIENYITFADKHYKTYYLPKKSGGKRAINCPGKNLKIIQRWILKNHLNKLEVNKRASGFVEKRGIKRNAMFHLNKRYLLTIDIENFFPSISQKQVFETLEEHISDRDFAIKIAKVCTFKRRLPQGAPTSPALSNLVFKKIDDEIMKYCNSELITYSRYADDLTFSSDNKHSLQFAYKFVNELLYKNGFNINKKKTRYLSGKGNMSVTGVNINNGIPKVNSKLKRQIRAELHHYIIKKEKINLRRLAGYISFISSIETDYKEKIIKYIENLKSKE